MSALSYLLFDVPEYKELEVLQFTREVDVIVNDDDSANLRCERHISIERGGGELRIACKTHKIYACIRYTFSLQRPLDSLAIRLVLSAGKLPFGCKALLVEAR